MLQNYDSFSFSESTKKHKRVLFIVSVLLGSTHRSNWRWTWSLRQQLEHRAEEAKCGLSDSFFNSKSRLKSGIAKKPGLLENPSEGCWNQTPCCKRSAWWEDNPCALSQISEHLKNEKIHCFLYIYKHKVCKVQHITYVWGTVGEYFI